MFGDYDFPEVRGVNPDRAEGVEVYDGAPLTNRKEASLFCHVSVPKRETVKNVYTANQRFRPCFIKKIQRLEEAKKKWSIRDLINEMFQDENPGGFVSLESAEKRIRTFIRAVWDQIWYTVEDSPDD